MSNDRVGSILVGKTYGSDRTPLPFPDGPRYRAGVELRAVQNGLDPDDWEPMKTVGPWGPRDQDQGRSGSVPDRLSGDAGGSGSRAACLSEEDAADGAAGHRAGRQASEA
jgi:hypothetical protein